MPLRGAPRGSLWRKEMRELLLGRGLWAALMISVLLSGYSYIQAAQLYGQASRAAENSPELGRGLSPLDGILVPTFGGLYLISTLLYPFVVIRTLGAEKQSGAVQLLLQLPYSLTDLLGAKLAAAVAAWAMLISPCLVAIGLWMFQGGHVAAFETANLLLGHFLFALVIAGVALAAAAAARSAASASIAAIGVSLGFWVLDFAAVGEDGLLKDLSAWSLTRVLKSFEAGIFSLGLMLAALCASFGLTALAGVWLRPDWSQAKKLAHSLLVVSLTVLAAAGSTQAPFYRDATEDRRNSFSPGDEALLRTLDGRLTIRVYLAPSDPRVYDLERNILGRLRRTIRHVSVNYQDMNANRFLPGEDDYGKVVYSYDGREAISRSASEQEVLPLLYQLAGVTKKPGEREAPYPGYPLAASSRPAEIVFYYLLPAIAAAGWLLSAGAWGVVKSCWLQIGSKSSPQENGRDL